MIKIRPHHLLCMRAYIGNGYSEEFKIEMEKVINMLKAFPKEDRIKIIEEIKDFVSNKAKQINAKEVEEEER